ncbi:MAG: hypothetical protein WA125_10565 [Desulfosporosinus sp.]
MVELQEVEAYRNDGGLSTEIAEVQKAAFICYTEDGDWDDALVKLKAIQKACQKFPMDRDNAENYVYCLRRTCFRFGEEKSWSDFKIWISALEELAAIFPESSEIVGAYALALSNRISGTQSSTKEKIKKRNANDIH